MNHTRQIHAHTLRRGVDHTRLLLLRLLSIPDLPYAHSLLLSLPTPPPPSLSNKLLQAYAARGPFPLALSLFSHMRLLPPSHRPTAPSFTFLFSACASFSLPRHGAALHALLHLSGHPLDPFLSTSLLDMYCKCSLLPHAHQLFDELPHKDTAAWNTLLTGYAKSTDLSRARQLFDAMPQRNVISWTSMVSGYSQNGHYEDAIDVFTQMWERGGSGVRPNHVTLASVLPACSNLGAMDLGERIEGYARANGFFGNLFVGNALMEMYAKCGSIDRARGIFEEMGERRNLCSWNSMIMGFAVHGIWREGLELFREMQVRGVAPDGITCVGFLLSCTHGGLVDQGRQFFESMEKEFSVKPRLEHYGCMVDLLGRAGLLNEAYSLISTMPMEPDAVIWGALLGACSFHGEVELAERAAGFLFELEPGNSGNHVILSNVYASSGRWDGVIKAWKMMKGKQQKKVAGYSFIELDGKMHKFLVGDKSHSRFVEIYSMLDEVLSWMKLPDDIPSFDHQSERYD